VAISFRARLSHRTRLSTSASVVPICHQGHAWSSPAYPALGCSRCPRRQREQARAWGRLAGVLLSAGGLVVGGPWWPAIWVPEAAAAAQEKRGSGRGGAQER
jgi:hypothetical protein